jgi:hypothetical protein
MASSADQHHHVGLGRYVRARGPRAARLVTTIRRLLHQPVLDDDALHQPRHRSAPPPVPAGITNSTGLVGSQAKAGVLIDSASKAAAQMLVLRRGRTDAPCS